MLNATPHRRNGDDARLGHHVCRFCRQVSEPDLLATTRVGHAGLREFMTEVGGVLSYGYGRGLDGLRVASASLRSA
jgi:hypothetical protein